MEGQEASVATRVTQVEKARALLQAGALERGLVKLRVHLANRLDDLEALALLIEASGQVAVGERRKWTLQAANTVNEIRLTGGMSEYTAARVGRLLLNRREMVGARAVARWIELHHPNGPHAGRFLPELYRQIGEPAAAAAALRRAFAANPDDIELTLQMAERLLAAGKASEAFPLAKSLKGRDSSHRALLVLARARIGCGDPESALPLALHVFQNGGSDHDLITVVRELAAAGAHSTGLALIDGMIAARGAARAEWLTLKADLYAASGAPAEASAALGQALELDPSPVAFERLFDSLIGLQRVPQAQAVARLMETAHPEVVRTRIVRMRALEAAGAEGEARAAEEEVVAHALYRASKRMHGRFVTLAGIIGSHGLGDFIYQLLALASLKRQFSGARLTLIYSNDLSYKDPLLRFCPDLDEVRDYAGGGIDLRVATKDWGDLRHNMVFPQAALSPTLLARLPRTATFVTPAGDVEPFTADLVARGLDPQRWFVAIHYRNSASFTGGAAQNRDVDPQTFHALAAEICAAGGQVVRLGHKGMDPIPSLPGYVDISDAHFSLQMFAVSKARFMIGCDSGPSGYATGFKTPLFKTNTFSEHGAAYETDIILPKNILNARGEVLRVNDALEDRMLFFKHLETSPGGFRMVDNSLEQLRHGMEIMMSRTAAGGWRPDAEPDMTPPPQAIRWPVSLNRRALLLDAAHLLGAPIRQVDADALARIVQ